MTPDAAYCSDDATAADAARQMAQHDIAHSRSNDTHGRLAGVITDRDLAVKIVAEGRDPATVRLRVMIDGTEVVTIRADDSVEEAIRTMKGHAVRPQ